MIVILKLQEWFKMDLKWQTRATNCNKCDDRIYITNKEYDEWIDTRGYCLCIACSGQRKLSDFYE